MASFPNPSLEQCLRVRRMVVWQNAKALAVRAQGRTFTPQECAAWDGLNAEMDAIDTRLAALRGRPQVVAEQPDRSLKAQPNYTRRPPPPAWPAGCWDVLRWQ